MNQMTPNYVYWFAFTDPRRRAMEILRRLWMMAAGLLTGAMIGALVYLFIRSQNPPGFQAESEFYLNFAIDPTGEAYDYYNGYTWNDLMTTDPIAGYTLEALAGQDVDVSKLEADTRADVLSDIRVLHVTITDGDEAVCTAISRATEKALISFGEAAREFDSIELIKSTGTVRIQADNRLMQALLLGGIIGLVASCIGVAFAVVLDDRICFAPEIRSLGIPVLDADAEQKDAVHIDAGNVRVTDFPLPGTILGNGENRPPVIIDLPYRRVHMTLLVRIIDELSAAGREIKAIRITDQDARAFKFYYFGR